MGNFIDKTFTVIADILLKVLPASKQEKQAFSYYRAGMAAQSRGRYAEALQNYYTSLEEGKADILGLYIVTKLYDMGELSSGELMDNYVTFMAGIFRSARFSAASAHGKANMMRFYYFQEKFSIKSVSNQFLVRIVDLYFYLAS